MSCGFIVGRDTWSEDFEQRTVESFADLLDVSAVTFPASPTTSISVAQRMVADMPPESKARLRKFYVDERAGKTLSQANANKILAAHEAIGSVLAAAGLGADEPEDGATATQATDTPSVDDTATQVDPGESVRKAPETATERREQSLSFGDQQSAVYEALCAKLTDMSGFADIWIRDLGPDWVVWESWDSPNGMYRLAYTLGDDGAITFDGTPEKVEQQTSYVPIEDPDESRESDPAPKTSRAIWLRAEARKRRVL